jgi:D-serine deaminase-like pyridoxal phosphate-dependent protein
VPHLKTAKSPEVAQLLLNAGAVGVCVAKLSEAEVMLAGGINDVLITTEIAGLITLNGLGCQKGGVRSRDDDLYCCSGAARESRDAN